MRSIIRIVVFFGLFLLCLSPSQALKVEITQGQVRPDPIAVTNFYSADTGLSKLGETISGVVSADLERSGLFEAISHAAFIQ